MNTNQAKKWVQSLLALPMLAAALALGGCESEDTDENITVTRFNIDRELRNYSDTDEYVWNTTLSEPTAFLRINDFTEGDTSIRIYDGRGVLVLSAALNTLDSVYFSGEDMYFQRRVARGEPGQWRIILGYGDFTGDYDLTIE